MAHQLYDNKRFSWIDETSFPCIWNDREIEVLARHQDNL